MPSEAKGGPPGCAVTADFNGDGRPDVAVCTPVSIGIFFNKGDGTLKSALLLGSPPKGLAGVDLNQDGRPDLVAVWGTTVQVYLNRGDGTFLAPVGYALPSVGFHGMLGGDFNGDGRKDIVVTYTGGTVVFFGQGDGTLKRGAPFYAAAVAAPSGDYQSLAAAGDVNGDGIDDLIINNFDGGFQVFAGQRSGTMGAPTVYSFQTSYAIYHLADMNGDGKPDIVAANQYSAFFVMLNDGHGTFGVARDIYPQNFGYGLPVVIADFDHNGTNDVVSFWGDEAWQYSFENRGKADFTDARIVRNIGHLYGSYTYSDMVADFDGDGLPDVASFDGSTIFLFRNISIPVAPVLTVSGLFPASAGNAGTVSEIRIIGTAFPADVKVALTGPGGVLKPISLTVSANGNLITCSFDLTSIAPGTYSLVLSDPSGATLFNKASALVVQQGGSADIWAELIGRSVLRAGKEQTFYLLVGNRGSIDAEEAEVWVSLPNFLGWSSEPEFKPSSVLKGSNTTLLSFGFLGTLGVGANITLPLRLTIPDTPEFGHKSFEVRVGTGN